MTDMTYSPAGMVWDTMTERQRKAARVMGLKPEDFGYCTAGYVRAEARENRES